MELDGWYGQDRPGRLLEVKEIGERAVFTVPSQDEAALSREEVTELVRDLQHWLGAPAPLTAADVRAIAANVANEVMALHQSPQARYADAVAARLCTVDGCTAFPGTPEHFEHGDPGTECRGGYGCDTPGVHVRYASGCGAPDPEPHDVGHPGPAEKPYPAVRLMREIKSVRRRAWDTLLGATPDPAYCADCGHLWGLHNRIDGGCTSVLGKGTCTCHRVLP